jgi:hypothetical protein
LLFNRPPCTSHITRHTSHVTRHTTHVTHHNSNTSHVTHHTGHTGEQNATEEATSTSEANSDLRASMASITPKTNSITAADIIAQRERAAAEAKAADPGSVYLPASAPPQVPPNSQDADNAESSSSSCSGGGSPPSKCEIVKDSMSEIVQSSASPPAPTPPSSQARPVTSVAAGLPLSTPISGSACR